MPTRLAERLDIARGTGSGREAPQSATDRNIAKALAHPKNRKRAGETGHVEKISHVGTRLLYGIRAGCGGPLGVAARHDL